MNKYKKILAVIIMTLLFGSGYYTALHFNVEGVGKEQEMEDAMKQQLAADADSIVEEQGREEKKEAEETEEKEEMEKAVKTAGSGGWVEKEETWDQEFEELLEKHVFGDWRFSRRIGVRDGGIYAPGAYYPNHYTEVDFSEQGVEEMKKIVIHYGRDNAGIVDGLNQATFSDAIDMYLFGMDAGGFRNISQPSYAMGTGAGRSVTYYYEEGEELGDRELLRICYGKWDRDWEESAKYVRNGDLYVDPEDTETLYLDFCGCWELKRAEKERDAIDLG